MGAWAVASPAAIGQDDRGVVQRPDRTLTGRVGKVAVVGAGVVAIGRWCPQAPSVCRRWSGFARKSFSSCWRNRA